MVGKIVVAQGFARHMMPQRERVISLIVVPDPCISPGVR